MDINTAGSGVPANLHVAAPGVAARVGHSPETCSANNKGTSVRRANLNVEAPVLIGFAVCAVACAEFLSPATRDIQRPAGNDAHRCRMIGFVGKCLEAIAFGGRACDDDRVPVWNVDICD